MSASVTPSGPFTPGQPATFKVTVTDAQNANITNATVAVEDGSDTWVGNGNHTMTPLLRAIPFGNGYTIFRAPLLRVTAPGHAPTSVSLNVTIPKLNVTRTPDTGLTSCAASAITITAKDAATGANVSGTVLVNGAPAGSTGTPITIRPTGLSANVSTPGRVGVSGTTSLTNCEAPEIWLRAAGYPDTLVYRPVRIQGTQVITRSMTIGEVRVPITTAVRTNVQQVQQIQQGPSQLNGGAAVH